MAFLEPIAAGFAGKALKLLAPLAGAAVLVAAGFAAGEVWEHRPAGFAELHMRAFGHDLHWSPLGQGLAAQRDAQRARADADAALALGWARSFGQSEALRRREGTQAVAAVNGQQAACQARVDAARRSASAISALVSKEPKHDAQGCPVRALVDRRGLCDATGGCPAG